MHNSLVTYYYTFVQWTFKYQYLFNAGVFDKNNLDKHIYGIAIFGKQINWKGTKCQLLNYNAKKKQQIRFEHINASVMKKSKQCLLRYWNTDGQIPWKYG